MQPAVFDRGDKRRDRHSTDWDGVLVDVEQDAAERAGWVEPGQQVIAPGGDGADARGERRAGSASLEVVGQPGLEESGPESERPMGLTLGCRPGPRATARQVVHRNEGAPLRRARLGRNVYLTRSRYSPVRVSMRIFSPGLMKGGTETVRPVSSLASLYWLVAVAPASDGGVSETVSSTKSGISIETGFSLMYLTITREFGSR